MELPKIVKIALGLISLLIIVNVLLLDIFFVRQRSDILDLQTAATQLAADFQTLGTRIVGSDFKVTTPTTTPVSANDTLQQIIDANTCPQACVTQINQVKTLIPTQTQSTPTVPVSTTTTFAKGEYFINLGSGSVSNTEASNTNWKTIDGAQATFDVANYGNIKSITLEATMHVLSAGEVHARLLDSTTPAIIWGADLSTTNSTATYVSGTVTLQPGAKTYKIQMYSTLSTGYLDQARIHIVTQ